MKVAIVHTDFKIYWPARLKAMQQLFYANDIELHIIEIASKGSPYSFANDEKRDKCDNWSVLFEDISAINSKDIKIALCRKLDTIQPEVVIAGAIAFYSGAISTYWAKKNKKRVVIFDDAKIESVPRGARVNFVKKKVYSAVDAVIYPSKEWLETANFWGFTEEQLFIGVDVVDNQFWKVENINKEKILLFVGRLIPRKNVLKLIKAFSEVSVNTDSKLLIVGDGEQKAEVEDLISKSHNIEHISFVQQGGLKDIYARASAFIIPSTYDTWGLVINEAMASGLPIWASSECGATNTLVKDGVNGVVFDPNNDNDIKLALTQFVNSDVDSLETMGRESQRIIKDWDLNLLASEALCAVHYVSARSPRKIDLVANIILRMWRGRYNQI